MKRNGSGSQERPHCPGSLWVSCWRVGLAFLNEILSGVTNWPIKRNGALSLSRPIAPVPFGYDHLITVALECQYPKTGSLGRLEYPPMLTGGWIVHTPLAGGAPC